VTKLQVAAAAADAYLTILAAQETVTAARAGVERARVLNRTVETLVTNQLRPGAEASRTRAELAVAETQLIQAEEAVEVGRAALAQLLGVSPQTIAVQSGPLLELPRDQPPAESSAGGWSRGSSSNGPDWTAIVCGLTPSNCASAARPTSTASSAWISCVSATASSARVREASAPGRSWLVTSVSTVRFSTRARSTPALAAVTVSWAARIVK